MFWLYLFLIVLLIASAFAVATTVVLIKTKVPFVSLNSKKIDRILELIEFNPDKKLYDLGCGDARFLVKAYQKYGVSGVGYELNWWGLFRSWWNVFIHRASVIIYNQNFLKADLSSADYIFVYLLPGMLSRLEKKLKENQCPGRLVISYGFALPNLSPAEILYTEDNKDRGRVFIYKI
jgi:hypothetical protein